MKSITKIFLSACVALLCFASCARIWEDRDIQIVNIYGGSEQAQCVSDGSIRFGNYVPATKAMAGLGPNGVGYGNFKIFGFADESVFMDPFNVEWQGNEWIYEGIGSQELQYFNRDVTQYDFIGIISDQAPTRTDKTISVENVEAFETTDPMNSPKEFLYTQKSVLPAEYGQYVTLNFNHGNARMFIGFASDRNDTKINDYTPYTPGTPGVDAWDEVIDVVTYEMTATTVPAQGPAIADIGITDEDIDYVNSKYTASKGFSNYATNNVITGPLDENMWTYLVGKYPTLSTATLNNWASNVGNANMRLIHIDKTGAYDTYVGVWVNVQNVNWSAGTTTQTTIHHDAIPAVPASGIEGIRVFSVDDSGTPITHKVHTVSATAHVTATDLTWDNVSSTSDVISFEKPAGIVAQAANTNIAWADATPSPTVRYALPVENTGYVVKFSYTYNGVNYYDARVLIPAVSANFEESKDYTYIIYITADTNGTTDPDQADRDKDEVDTTQKAIVFSEVSFSNYVSGGNYVYSIL